MFNFLKKKKKEPKNIKEILSSLAEIENNFAKVSQEIKELKEKNQRSLQKIGLIRYNPFKEIGGNQSFSLAFLDSGNSGLVLPGLWSKQGNRIYAKPVSNGQSKYPLSEEEKKVIAQAKL